MVYEMYTIPGYEVDGEADEYVGDEVADPGLPHLHDDVVHVSLLHVLVNVRQRPAQADSEFSLDSEQLVLKFLCT